MRICSCKGGVATCAIHTLWQKFFAGLPDGARPWAHVSADCARQRLRQALEKLGVQGPGQYGTHDFRRGHAEVSPCSVKLTSTLWACMHACQDLRKSGATLAQILSAGQWKSPAFLNYLNEAGLLWPVCAFAPLFFVAG